MSRGGGAVTPIFQCYCNIAIWLAPSWLIRSYTGRGRGFQMNGIGKLVAEAPQFKGSSSSHLIQRLWNGTRSLHTMATTRHTPKGWGSSCTKPNHSLKLRGPRCKTLVCFFYRRQEIGGLLREVVAPLALVCRSFPFLPPYMAFQVCPPPQVSKNFNTPPISVLKCVKAL